MAHVTKLFCRRSFSTTAKFANATAPKNIAVINCGSATLKFQVVDPVKRDVKEGGVVERLNTNEAFIKYTDAKKREVKKDLGLVDHKAAFDKITEIIREEEFVGIGHRVVHGGETFT